MIDVTRKDPAAEGVDFGIVILLMKLCTLTVLYILKLDSDSLMMQLMRRRA